MANIDGKKIVQRKFNVETLNEFYGIQWQDEPRDPRDIFHRVNKTNPLSLAKYGQLLSFRNLMMEKFPLETLDLEEKIQNFFNLNDEEKGYNIIHCAILNEKFEFTAKITRFFGSLIDFRARIQEGAKVPKKSKEREIGNVSTFALLVAALIRYRAKEASQPLERVLETANYFSSGIAVSCDSLLPPESTNIFMTAEVDREKEILVHSTIMEYVTYLENSINRHDSQGIGACLLNLKTQIHCLKPYRKDTIIIEMVEAMKNFSKISDYQRRLDLLDTLKNVTISNIGSPISFQTDEIKNRLFDFLYFAEKWCEAELSQSKAGDRRSLYVRGRYLTNVTFAALTTQFRFLDEDQTFYSKLIHFSKFVGLVASAATLDLQSAVLAIVETADFIVRQINTMKAGRLRGLITLIEGINLAVTAATDTSTKLQLFQSVCLTFDNIKKGVVEYNDWILFYGVLEICLQLALENRDSGMIQEAVCTFLLNHLHFNVNSKSPLAHCGEISSIISKRIWEIVTYLSLFPLHKTVLSRYSVLHDQYPSQMSSVSYVTSAGLWMQTPDFNVRLMYLLLSTSNPPLFMDIRQSNLTGSVLQDYIIMSIIEKNREVCLAIDEASRMDLMHDKQQIIRSLASFLVDVFEHFEDRYSKCLVSFVSDLKEYLLLPPSISENNSAKISSDDIPEENLESHKEQEKIDLSVDEATIMEIIKEREELGGPRSFNMQESIWLLHYLINSEEIKEVDQGLLLVGATGAGKSTLANILAGCDMIYAESLVSVSTASSVVEQTKIGDASTSCTLKTQLVETNDWTIGDTAGLQDVRGFEFSVANAVNIVRFLGRCKNVRIMLVTALNWLETPVTRNSVALPIWKQLKEMFGENIDIALSSMIFGFTRNEFPKMLVRIKEFYTACNLRLDQVPYVLIPPPTSDVDKEEYIESIRSAINDVDPLPDCGSLMKQNVVLLEDTIGHLKMILKALSNIQPLLEKDLVKDVVDRFALIENLKFIRSQVIDEGIEEFRNVLKDFFEKISSKVNKILADKPSHHGCRKLKKLIQSLDKATILDSCFLNVDGFENFASKKKIEILNDILIKEIQLQDKTNQILKYKTDSQLALLNNAIELMSNKMTKDTNFELVKSIAEVNGEVDELYDAVSIPDLRGSCSATLALMDELNREIIEFPFLYVNPIVSSLQEYRNRLFHTATMRIQELIELAKKLVRATEFKKSFDSVKLFACRIPDCDLDKLINCLMTIDGSVDQIELLNCVGFKKSDLLTMQRIGNLSMKFKFQLSLLI